MEVCNIDENRDITFVDLISKLKDLLSQSSVPVASNNVGGVPGEATAGDGTFYVDRILKRYFDYKQDDSIDGSPTCSSTSSTSSTLSPLQMKQER